MRQRGRAGNMAVEFALIAPALVGLLLLVLEMGFLLYAQTTLDFAAREAAGTCRPDRLRQPIKWALNTRAALRQWLRTSHDGAYEGIMQSMTA